MNHDSIKKYYEQVYTDKTDKAFAFDEQRYKSWLKNLPAPANPQSRSLDIGCGAGYICHLLQQSGYEVHGNDISSKAIGLAQKRVPSGHFRLSHASGKLEYPDEHFDLITCLGVLEHIPQPERVLQECVRVLKKGSHALFIVPNSRNPYFWFGGTEQIEEHPRSLKQWSTLFQSCGLTIVNVTKDQGPACHKNCSTIKKIKISLHKILNLFPIGATYQFNFLLKK